MQISTEQAYQHGYQDGKHNGACPHAWDDDLELRYAYQLGYMAALDEWLDGIGE